MIQVLGDQQPFGMLAKKSIPIRIACLLLFLVSGCNAIAKPSANGWFVSSDRNASARIVPISEASVANREPTAVMRSSLEVQIDEQHVVSSLGTNEEVANAPHYDPRESLFDRTYDTNQGLEFSRDEAESLTKLGDNSLVFDRLVRDQSNFYSRESLLGLGVAFGTGAAFANTGLDEQLQKHFQASVRGATSDEWFEFLHSNKELGNGTYSLPVYGALWVANEYVDGPPVFESLGAWGERSMRGFIVGAPPLVLMQRLTGGSRPYETSEGAQWHPMRDNNGVSGHAFMSSLPFITAAKMSDDPWQKTFWYSASAIGPLSRVNDNAHYPSQIGLGWVMAFMAATAVNQTHTGKRGWSLVSSSNLTSTGAALQYTW